MNTPAQFKEDRKEVLHTLIRQHSFGALITCGKSGASAGHIPFVLHEEISTHGVLRGRVARSKMR